MKSKIKVMRCILVLCIVCAVCIVLDPFQLPGKPGNPDPRDQGQKDQTAETSATSTASATSPTVTTVVPRASSVSSAPVVVPPEIIEALPYPHPFYDSQILDAAIVNPVIENINCPFAIDQRKILAVLKILAKYSTNDEFRNDVNAQTELSESFVKGLADKLAEFNNNPFLKDFMNSFKCTLSSYLLSLQQQQANLQRFQIFLELTPEEASLPTGTGLLSPAAVAETLSTFIAKRFKEELAILFLNEFIFNLDQAKETGWGILFPSTITFLSDTIIYDFKVFLPTLNAVFIDDLNHIDSNLLPYFLKKRELLLKEKQNTGMGEMGGTGNIAPEISSTTNISIPKDESLINFSIFVLNINKSIRTGEHPSRVFSVLNRSEYLEQIDERIANPIRLMAMVSRSLVNKTRNGWVTSGEFDMLLFDINKEFRKLLIGLMYAKEKNEMEKIAFGGKSLTNMLAENEKIMRDMIDYMHKYTIIAESLQEQINLLRYVGQLAPAEFHNYLNIIYKLVNFGLELNAFDNDIQYDPNIKKEYLAVLEDLMAVSQDVIDTNYGLAVVNIVKLLNTMQIEDADSIKRFMRYGNFMVSIVESETTLNMEEVLEAIAMPIGGYRVTRVSPFSFSIGAYAGISGGRQIIQVKPETLGVWNLSPAAPIGLSFSIGGGNFNKPGPSWSLFLPIIDIGAPFMWQLSGDDKGISEVTWRQLIGPGAYIIYGIKNSPISIGAGIQYRYSSTQDASAFRVQMLLGIEIPIFNIYSKGKKNNR